MLANFVRSHITLGDLALAKAALRAELKQS